jgi:hypothetical protein
MYILAVRDRGHPRRPAILLLSRRTLLSFGGSEKRAHTDMHEVFLLAVLDKVAEQADSPKSARDRRSQRIRQPQHPRNATLSTAFA